MRASRIVGCLSSELNQGPSDQQPTGLILHTEQDKEISNQIDSISSPTQDLFHSQGPNSSFGLKLSGREEVYQGPSDQRPTKLILCPEERKEAISQI